MRTRLVRVCLLLWPCLGLLACQSWPFGASSSDRETAFKLPSLPVPRDSVELDIVFVDRPAGDPLLGKSLWSEVDQVGALSMEQRAALREAGIRVGQVGSSPPATLQALLDLADEESVRKRREANGRAPTAAKRVVLPAGSDTEIQASEPVTSRVIQTSHRTSELFEARGVLRLRAERSQDGWAKLDFLPELHHGATRTRPFAVASGWQYRTAQEVLPFFEQQFAVNLNIGEMLVITADREAAGSLGQQLFQFEDSAGAKQRVIVVRLTDLREIVAQRISSE